MLCKTDLKPIQRFTSSAMYTFKYLKVRLCTFMLSTRTIKAYFEMGDFILCKDLD